MTATAAVTIGFYQWGWTCIITRALVSVDIYIYLWLQFFQSTCSIGSTHVLLLLRWPRAQLSLSHSADGEGDVVWLWSRPWRQTKAEGAFYGRTSASSTSTEVWTYRPAVFWFIRSMSIRFSGCGDRQVRIHQRYVAKVMPSHTEDASIYGYKRDALRYSGLD